MNPADAPPNPTHNHQENPVYPTLFTTPGMKPFAEAVDAERQRQLAKWGDQQHPDGTGDRRWRDAANYVRGEVDDDARLGRTTWQGILREKVFEALAESDPAKLRAELLQVAAVCAAWVSDLDRRGHSAPEERTVTAENIAELFQWIPAEQLHMAGCSTVRLTLLVNGERQVAQLGDTIVRDSRGVFTVQHAEEQR